MAGLWSSAAYRIAFTFTAAVAMATLVLGLAVYFVADAEFRQQRDSAITAQLAELVAESQDEQDRDHFLREISEREGSMVPGSFRYALFDQAGRQVGGTLDTRRPPAGFSMIAYRDGEPEADAARPPDGAPETARAKAIDLPDGERLVVAIGTKALESIDRTILTLFGMAFVVLLAVSVAGALLLGRYLRHRLGTISATAQAVIAGDFSRRMPIGPTRDEFDTAAMALNTMLDRITRLMDNLRQVSSDVAHDLRTPLMRLRGQLELVGKAEGAEQRAIEQGDELLKLFAAILRISEVEGGKLEQGFVAVALSALAQSVAEDFLPALADGGHLLDWKVQPGIVVNGNRELLAQALANLLDNARVHTPAGTRVTVELAASENQALLSVRDNGPGIPPADRENILRRFYRGEASRTTPGNGLGLSLVAAVAAAHGGEVTVGAGQPGLIVTLAFPLSTLSTAS